MLLSLAGLATRLYGATKSVSQFRLHLHASQTQWLSLKTSVPTERSESSLNLKDARNKCKDCKTLCIVTIRIALVSLPIRRRRKRIGLTGKVILVKTATIIVMLEHQTKLYFMHLAFKNVKNPFCQRSPLFTRSTMKQPLQLHYSHDVLPRLTKYNESSSKVSTLTSCFEHLKNQHRPAMRK